MDFPYFVQLDPVTFELSFPKALSDIMLIIRISDVRAFSYSSFATMFQALRKRRSKYKYIISR